MLSLRESVDTRIVQALPYVSLVFFFVFAGLTGHDPWKADEAYIFGVVQHMLETSDLVIPILAGEPFMAKPPLFYWVATAFASLFVGRLGDANQDGLRKGWRTAKHWMISESTL